MDLLHLRAYIFERPLAIHPAKFEIILGAIGDRLGINPTLEQIEAASQPFKAKSNAYAVQDGIAIIPINGSLMKKTSGLMAASGCTSYQAIGDQFQDAMSNSAVKGVLLDIDSPGGSTSALFELCDLLSSDHSKPIYAIADDACYSAAYALASSADKIFLTRTAGVGSIGVFCAHIDQSGADKQEGLKYTFVKAGARKIDGNQHEPLSSAALESTQAEVDRQYQMFVSLVASNRNASEADIVDTQAGCFYGENAIPLLADQVGTFEDALSALIEATSQPIAIKSPTKKRNVLNISDAHKAMQEDAMEKKLEELDIDELVAQAATATETEAEEAKTVPVAEDSKADDEECDDDEDEDKKDAKGNKSHASAVRIVNLCTLAGMPALASTFLTKNYSVEEVEKALLKHRAEKSKAVKIASGSPSNTDTLKAAFDRIQNDKNIKNKAEVYGQFLKQNGQAYVAYLNSRGN